MKGVHILMRYNIILIIKYQTEKSLSTNFRKIPESKTKVSSIKSEVPAQLLDAIFPYFHTQTEYYFGAISYFVDAVALF